MPDSRKLAINLYAESSWERFLSNFKFWEEPYEVVDKMIPRKATILDLGCGEGLLSNFIALSSPERKIVSFEIAPERLARAKKGLKNVSFHTGNILNIDYPKSDIVILFHVLHHLPSRMAQQTVLEKIKKALSKGGKLIVVDVHIQPTYKYILAWIADHFLVPWVFERRFYTPAFFRKKDDWIKLLKKIGYNVKITEATSGRPFPNIIFECSLN